MVDVIDDWISDPYLVHFVYKDWLHNFPHYFSGASKRENERETEVSDVTFYNHDFDPENQMTLYLANKLMAQGIIDKNLVYDRIHLNIQMQGMGINSKFHKDKTVRTALWMVSPNDIEGAEFLYLDAQRNVQQIEYRQNRLIFFDGGENFPHKANPPTNYVPRMTVAFKAVDEKIYS
jgi:hypothetical protein